MVGEREEQRQRFSLAGDPFVIVREKVRSINTVRNYATE